MANSRKQVTFDLDTKILEKYYPTKSWQNAYEVIKKHMINNGFEWLQGSVYITKNPVSQTRVSIVLKDLVKKIRGSIYACAIVAKLILAKNIVKITYLIKMQIFQ